MPYLSKIHMVWQRYHPSADRDPKTWTLCGLIVEGQKTNGFSRNMQPALAVTVDEGWDNVNCGSCLRSTKEPESMKDQPRPMFIAYHGTTAQKAPLIEKTGFKEWCYFARHLEDALEFGKGGYVFEVAFYADEPASDRGWQFRNETHIEPDRIVSLTRYAVTTMNENDELREKVRLSGRSE